MGWEIILSLLMAAISFFTAKKAGATPAQAAAIAAAAGAGTYYVANNTDWGKSVISDIDKKWIEMTDPNGTVYTDVDGPVYAPEGSVVVKDPQGNPVVDSAGRILTQLVTTTGEVLTSWGPAGTAGVIATGALVADGIGKYVPWIVGGVLALMLIS